MKTIYSNRTPSSKTIGAPGSRAHEKKILGSQDPAVSPLEPPWIITRHFSELLEAFRDDQIAAEQSSSKKNI